MLGPQGISSKFFLRVRFSLWALKYIGHLEKSLNLLGTQLCLDFSL